MSIEGTFDFGQGPVPAHQHTNPNGAIGGWVADTAHVAPTAFVGADARVSGNTWVYGNAWVSGNALVYDNALVSSPADVAWGHAGGHDWTTYRLEGGGVFLRYGCEAHPLEWWRDQGPKLLVRHGHPAEHWGFVQIAVQAAEALHAKESPP